MSEQAAEIDYMIELRGVYDGWSIAVHKDGTIRNRWADEDGKPIPGYERRFNAAADAIALMAPEPEYVDCTCGHLNADHVAEACPFPGCGCGALDESDNPRPPGASS